MDAYRKLDRVNFSTLKHAAKSAAHYRLALDTPDNDTTGRAKGRLTHAAVLDPDSLMRDFVAYEGDRRGKAWAAFCEQHPEKTIVRMDEYEAALAQRDALLAHPAAGPILRSEGEREKVITWTDEPTGLDCKGRLDLFTGVLYDLKGTRSIEAGLFGAEAARSLYHAQLAFYLMGLRANGYDADRAALICVEYAPPYDVAVFTLTDDDLWLGETICRDLLAKVAAGRFSGAWPGRYPEAQPLRIPAWAFPDTDNDDALAGLILGGDEEAA